MSKQRFCQIKRQLKWQTIRTQMKNYSVTFHCTCKTYHEQEPEVPVREVRDITDFVLESLRGMMCDQQSYAQKTASNMLVWKDNSTSG